MAILNYTTEVSTEKTTLKADLERAIDMVANSIEFKNLYFNSMDDSNDISRHDLARMAIAAFHRFIAIDEDKAVEVMCEAIKVEIMRPYNDMLINGRSEVVIDENLGADKYAKAALHASPYYKLVKMMGE